MESSFLECVNDGIDCNDKEDTLPAEAWILVSAVLEDPGQVKMLSRGSGRLRWMGNKLVFIKRQFEDGARFPRT